MLRHTLIVFRVPLPKEGSVLNVIYTLGKLILETHKLVVFRREGRNVVLFPLSNICT